MSKYIDLHLRACNDLGEHPPVAAVLEWLDNNPNQVGEQSRKVLRRNCSRLSPPAT